MKKSYTWDDVSGHNNRESCWVVLNNQIYDVTQFLPHHPGGSKAILNLTGADASEMFNMIHPRGTLEDNIDKLSLVGTLEDNQTSNKNEKKEVILPALEAMLNVDDFEKNAKNLLDQKTWAYYHSGSDDMVTKEFNNHVFKKVLLRPRVFKDVVNVDTSSSISGYKTSMPIFISPAAMARLAHPSGESGIANAAGEQGVAQIISNNASMRFEDIVDSGHENQKFFFQLYVQNDRSISEKILKSVINTGKCQGIVLTLDAPTPGKREADERIKNDGAVYSEASGNGKVNKEKEEGLGRALFAGTAADLTWQTTLPWLVDQLPQNYPIILKGVQTYEDALLAAAHPNVRGIILSNHGGRAMDSAQPPLLILQEIRHHAPEVFSQIEVHIDGGIKRGTDIVKALCLGATQVGIGRAALYSLAGYGSPGVRRMLENLQSELQTSMRLLGANNVSELSSKCVNTRMLDNIVYGKL